MNSLKINAIGFIFLFFGLFSIINSLFIIENPNQLFWFCYAGLILLSIGAFTRNGYLIGAQICILLIPLIFWNLDFFARLLFNYPLFNVTAYMFIGSFNFSKFISLQHIFSVPLALYLLSLIKTKKINFWKGSILQVSLTFVFVYLFTNPESNVNCVFEPCISLTLGLSYYLEWFIGTLFMILVVNLLFYQIKYIRKKVEN